MNERAKAGLNRIIGWWKGQSSGKKLRLGGLLAFGVAIVVVGLGFITSPNWQPLYTHLNARTAGQITSQLTTMKIPYQLSNQGGTILVPKKDVDQVRVSLADQNIPSSGNGASLPTSSFTLGETSSEIQLNQLATVEATLEQTINSITGVHSSRVMINQPAPTLFGETQSQATASVFVDLTPGAHLSTAQVRGIMNLVAHSVSGLSVRQVTVVNQNGIVLSAAVLAANGAGSSLSGVSSKELQAESLVDGQIRSNVQSMLDSVLGPGNAVVQVHAILNFDQQNVQSTQYGKGTLSSQQVQSSVSSGSTPTSQTGTGGNTPTTVYPSTTTTPNNSNSKTTVSNYLVNTIKTTKKIPAGAVQRLTVAVVVDQKLSAAQTRSLKSLVGSAAGINVKQGDQLTVVGMPFNRSAVTAAVAAMKKAQTSATIRQGAMAAVGALILFLLFLMARRTMRSRPPAEHVLPAPAMAVGQNEFQPPVSVADLLNEMRAVKEPPSMTAEARDRLDDLAKNNPELAARLLKAWMEEESE